jgi:NAD(P)H-dependent flavin oxidoreductase YrpB (nitropropane dioxygenase family)
MLAATGFPVTALAELLDQVQKRSARPFGVNFIPGLRPTNPECVQLAASRARLVEFFFAEPDATLVEAVHCEGALAGWQVGSLEEAVQAEDVGCDVVVVQAIEAGGHVRGTIGLLPLLDQVLPRLSVPVVAAGGIGTGRAMAAVLAAGADAVRMGTRFVAAAEHPAHPVYVEALLRSEPQDTIHTERFSGGWRINAPHRVLRSSLEAAEAFEGDLVGERIRVSDGARLPIARFQGDFTPRTPLVSGHVEAMAMWAGESVGAVRRIQSAAEIIDEVVAEADALLSRWSAAPVNAS